MEMDVEGKVREEEGKLASPAFERLGESEASIARLSIRPNILLGVSSVGIRGSDRDEHRHIELGNWPSSPSGRAEGRSSA